MERIDELIEMCEKAKCPKDYEQCPLYPYNDCDNYCPFVEIADILREHKMVNEPKLVDDIHPSESLIGFLQGKCPSCCKIVSTTTKGETKYYGKTNYCEFCGQAVKWEEEA